MTHTLIFSPQRESTNYRIDLPNDVYAAILDLDEINAEGTLYQVLMNNTKAVIIDYHSNGYGGGMITFTLNTRDDNVENWLKINKTIAAFIDKATKDK